MGHRVYRPLYTQPLIQGDLKKTVKKEQNQQSNFANELQSVLESERKGLTISKHAQARLEQRGIDINETQWKQIGEKVTEAKNLGVKESLVLLDDVALIVSAKNNTVITAMNRAEATEQIFTNINGTILMN
ncbi:flagellar protein [Bacillus sp. V3B]|uniref:TIGR02530 family flagellar biosynthesis protein n=1 Tax=Bacillus sp. V3B TaxID=2804915 RepID=UPI0021099BA7|nr:TIGR02530 family flagellar biosynthesis protein [Bacillus sp. V3B]MCQ6274099.1 flagellar protein [Bacillus sp. V3B]